MNTFDYHVSWRSRGKHSGSHTSTQRGMGMEFRGHTTLLNYPDPRRIDLRQTLRDPHEQVYVRVFNQKSAVPIYAVCDLSASMAEGKPAKLQLASQIITSIAESAQAQRDPFALIGFSDHVQEALTTTPSFRPQQALSLAKNLAQYPAQANSANGITEIYRYLPRERCLVFLISDFHFAESLLESALANLFRHHIVPMVLWSKAEYTDLPALGLLNMSDSESHAQRTVFLRQALRERIVAAFEQRRNMLYQNLCALIFCRFMWKIVLMRNS